MGGSAGALDVVFESARVGDTFWRGPHADTFDLQPRYRLTRIDDTRTLGETLVDGELDARTSAKMPRAFRDGSEKVRGLFDDAAAEDAAYLLNALVPFRSCTYAFCATTCTRRTRRTWKRSTTGSRRHGRSPAWLYDSDALTVISPLLLCGMERAHEVLVNDY